MTAEGTLVLTSTGWKPIETIGVGERVLSHKGWRPVTDTVNLGPRETVTTSGYGGIELATLPNQRFLLADSSVDSPDGLIRRKHLTTRPLAEQKRPRQIYKHGHIWTPIGKQRTSGTHTIHNLHVAEDNSYLAEGIITQTINPKETH